MIDLVWPRELLLDILSTAVEYSCTNLGWGQVETFQWYWWYVPDADGEPTREVNPDLTDESVLFRVRDDDPDEDGREDDDDTGWVDITFPKLTDAINRAYLEYNHLFGSLTFGKGVVEDVDYDALTADAILQYVVLGKVVYG